MFCDLHVSLKIMLYRDILINLSCLFIDYNLVIGTNTILLQTPTNDGCIL